MDYSIDEDITALQKQIRHLEQEVDYLRAEQRQFVQQSYTQQQQIQTLTVQLRQQDIEDFWRLNDRANL